MANDVKVRILGDAGSLQAAVNKAQGLLKNLAARGAIASRSLVSGFSTLAKSAVNATRTAGKLTKIVGATAIGFKAATVVANALGDALTEVFTRGARQAKAAAEIFKQAFGSLVDVKLPSFQQFTIGSREELVAAGRAARAELKRINDDLEGRNVINQTGGVGGVLGSVVTGAVDAGKRLLAQVNDRVRGEVAINDELLRQRESARSLLEFYETQLKVLDEQKKVAKGLNEEGILSLSGVAGSGVVSSPAIEGLRQLAAAQLEVVGATNQLIAAEDLRQVQAIRGNTLLAEQQRQYDLLFQKIGALDQAALQLADSGARAVADLALGFGSLQEVLEGVKQTIRGIVQDLLAAAAKAAILSILFPGTSALAGGFGGIFRGFLGLTPFASGGVVTGPTPALIGERGPEAVIPLDRLGALGARKMEVVGFRMSGGDLLLSIQEAQQTRGVGGVTLT